MSTVQLEQRVRKLETELRAISERTRRVSGMPTIKGYADKQLILNDHLDVLQLKNLALGVKSKLKATPPIYYNTETGVITFDKAWADDRYAPRSHVGDSSHITSFERDNWDAAYTHAQSDHAPADANNYIHPDTHPATMIDEDSSHRFVTDTQIADWDAKSELVLGETSVTAYRGDRGAIAYDHSQSAHAYLSDSDPRIDDWDAAYGWGNHADAGYLTSETDPTVPSHVKNIASGDITNWDAAYDHSQSPHDYEPSFGALAEYPNVTDLAYNAPIKLPDFRTTADNMFVPVFHTTTRIQGGYRKHVSIGSYRTGSAWGGGIYFAQGGNDNYPTEYFLMGYGGAFQFISNDGVATNFWHDGNFDPADYVAKTGSQTMEGPLQIGDLYFDGANRSIEGIGYEPVNIAQLHTTSRTRIDGWIEIPNMDIQSDLGGSRPIIWRSTTGSVRYADWEDFKQQLGITASDVSGNVVSSGYVPYSNGSEYVDSPIRTDGTRVGIGRSSASDAALAVGGKTHIDGLLGIGRSDPLNTVHVHDNATEDNFVQVTNGTNPTENSGAQLGVDAEQFGRLKLNGIEAVRVDNVDGTVLRIGGGSNGQRTELWARHENNQYETKLMDGYGGVTAGEHGVLYSRAYFKAVAGLTVGETSPLHMLERVKHYRGTFESGRTGFNLNLSEGHGPYVHVISARVKDGYYGKWHYLGPNVWVEVQPLNDKLYLQTRKETHSTDLDFDGADWDIWIVENYE